MYVLICSLCVCVCVCLLYFPITLKSHSAESSLNIKAPEMCLRPAWDADGGGKGRQRKQMKVSETGSEIGRRKETIKARWRMNRTSEGARERVKHSSRVHARTHTSANSPIGNQAGKWCEPICAHVFACERVFVRKCLQRPWLGVCFFAFVYQSVCMHECVYTHCNLRRLPGTLAVYTLYSHNEW